MTLTAPTSAELATYLGSGVDQARADMLLSLAVDQCSAVVTPLPDEATAVVLSATARAYTNPAGVTQEGAGPFQVTRPSAGVYLTRAERSTLRRLAGGGNAFSIDLAGINGAGDATDYPDARFPEWS